jgi:hypothetical protein
MEGQDGSALTVVLPVRAATTLAGDRAVESIREVAPTPRGTPENVAPHRPAADALRLTPLGNVTLWGSGQYVYDGAGNITAIGTASAPNSDGKTSTFTYDVASRLTEASIGRVTGLGDIRESYRYDGFGNLKTHQRTSPDSITYSPLPSPTNNRMTESGVVYDNAAVTGPGNVTAIGGQTLTYDALQSGRHEASEWHDPAGLHQPRR